MQAKDVPVGDYFNLKSWGSEKGIRGVSSEHIFAVNDINQLICIHPDNSVNEGDDIL
jgi:hypothetical protein